MIYTNVLSNSFNKRVDIYTHLSKIIEYNKYKINEYNIFKNIYLNRDIIKYTIMTYIYGSTGYAVSNRLYNDFKVNTLLLTDLIIICNNIIQSFKELFPCIPLLKSFMTSYINNTVENRFIELNIFDRKIKYNPPKIIKKKIKCKKTKYLIDKEEKNILQYINNIEKNIKILKNILNINIINIDIINKEVLKILKKEIKYFKNEEIKLIISKVINILLKKKKSINRSN